MTKQIKQQITLEQWNELSDEEQFKLYDKDAGSPFELPTIGQLIEYLGDDLVSMENLLSGGWDILVRGAEDDFWQQELITALWEATKHKLKQV